jgi:Mrp family chromosome partitioning ATPase
MEGGRIAAGPFTDHDQQKKPVGNGSFEDMYYQGNRPQSVNCRAEEPAPKIPSKSGKARFVPRTSSGGLITPYPGLLSKMQYSLSDTWANVMLETGQSAQTLLVCGSAGKEGVTMISFHLAMFLSKEYNMKVLYVDTNLNHTAIPDMKNLPGVYSFVSEQKDLAPLILQTEYPGFYLLPSGSGTIPKNIGGNMLSREPIENLLQFCRSHFDMTIIDGQPLVSSPVMFEFARAADLTLLVCRYGYSRHEVSKIAIDKLHKYGITSIGVILNDRKFPVPQKLYRLMG